MASKKYKEGELALHKARQMQSEQQARLQVLQRQQERLRQQEEHVHQVPHPHHPSPCAHCQLLSPVLGWV